MICQYCGGNFPKKKGRFCGQCGPLDRPGAVEKELCEIRYRLIYLLDHVSVEVASEIDDAIFGVEQARDKLKQEG